MDTFICVRYSNKGNTCRTAPVYQYDKGIQLHVLNLNESHVVQIHYSISGMYQALTQTPTYEVDKWISNIPNVLLAQQEEIQAYIYVSDGKNSSQTVMHISIPVTPRPKPDGYEYTEAELKGLDYVLSQVSEAVAGVDDAVAKAYAAYEHIPYIDVETNHWMQWDVLTEQFVDTGIIAIGQPGKDGSDGKDGLDGKDGKDFVILGVVATADELAIKAPNPKQGDHYNVGPDDRGMYLLYMYDTELGWVDKGVANGGGSGSIVMDFDDSVPQPLGEGKPGTSESPSRSDHEHPMPTAKDIGALYVDPNGSEAGPPALINADTLGGIPAADYAKKSDIQQNTGSSLPAGGTTGQILAKKTSTDGDVEWINPPEETLKTICNKEADENGNVDIDASDVGAVSLPEEEDPTYGVATGINADMLGGNTADYYATKDDLKNVSGSSGASIDDTEPSAFTTYSSEKIEHALSELKNDKADKSGWTANKYIGTDESGNMIVKDVSSYTLPQASSSTLGGVKVGDGLSIDENGILSLNIPVAAGVSF